MITLFLLCWDKIRLIPHCPRCKTRWFYHRAALQSQGEFFCDRCDDWFD